MSKESIVIYIKNQKGKGVSDENIIKNLKEVGWSQDAIKDAYMEIVNMPKEPVLATTQTLSSQDINSPYSVTLAILLFVSLFTLVNGAFSDIKHLTTDANKMLLYEGVFVIPFLLIAFLMNQAFQNDKKRFQIISIPYFSMGAWLLLKLLWKVGENILNANAAVGIYLVLGLVILILTGIIIFVGKHMHS